MPLVFSYLLSFPCIVVMVAISGFEPESAASQATMLLLLHHTTEVSRSDGSDRAESDSDTKIEGARANPTPPYFSVLNHILTSGILLYFRRII